jgi:hypothetical protein
MNDYEVDLAVDLLRDAELIKSVDLYDRLKTLDWRRVVHGSWHARFHNFKNKKSLWLSIGTGEWYGGEYVNSKQEALEADQYEVAVLDIDRRHGEEYITADFFSTKDSIARVSRTQLADFLMNNSK